MTLDFPTVNSKKPTFSARSAMPDGRIEKLRLGNGLWESAKFNSRLQVTEFNLGHGPAAGGLWKLQQEYGELQTNGTIDTAKNTGNIARQTLSFNGLAQPFVTSYKYDSLYRLTEARETSNSNQTWKQNFSYDRYGNRTGFTQDIHGQQMQINNLTLPTIDANTNRFTANQGYGFDKNGNLVSDPAYGGRQFVFNGDNKQKEVCFENGSQRSRSNAAPNLSETQKVISRIYSILMKRQSQLFWLRRTILARHLLETTNNSRGQLEIQNMLKETCRL